MSSISFKRRTRQRFPPIALVVPAAVGAILLVGVAANAWPKPADERAYWIAAQRLVAGEMLYQPTAIPDTPYVYWYPPPLAQVLAPLTRLLSPDAFSALWILLLLGCLWYLSGRDPLVALAMIAFVPVAAELQARNVHLVLAVLIVLALRHSSLFWVPAAAIKIAPVLGILYLIAAGRPRQAALVTITGGVVLVASLLISPGPWLDFGAVVGTRGADQGGGLLPIPYPARFLVGALLVAAGGRMTARAAAPSAIIESEAAVPERASASARRLVASARRPSVPRGELVLVVGLTIANPTLWVTAFSLLAALVPLARPQPPAQVSLHLESAGSKQSG